MEKENKKSDPRRSRIRMIILYILTLVITCAACLSYSGYVHYDEQLESEGELMSIMAEQVSLSINTRLSKLEDATISLMSIMDNVSYDPDKAPAGTNAADTSQTAADTAGNSTRTESMIDMNNSDPKLAELNKYITSLSMIDNYCDFAVIYNNGSTAGKLSDGTREDLPGGTEDIYNGITALVKEDIRNRRAKEGKSVTDDEAEPKEVRLWVTGVNNNYDKVYFINRVSEKAYFLGSFYSEELKFMLTPVNGKETCSVSLKDMNDNIIICAGSADTAPMEPKQLKKYVSIKAGSVHAVTTMDTGWKVVISRDMTAVSELYRKLALESAAVLLLALALLLVLYIVNFRDDAFIGGAPLMTPDVDILTGITNEEEAENLAADRLETCISGSTLMLALVKITNLGEIAQRYGRAGYNGAIIKTFRGLAVFFGTDDPDCKNILGRAGDGMFLVMADYTQYDLFKANDNLKEGLVRLSESLNSICLDTAGDIHICVGAAVYPHNSTDYDELFEMAEKALDDAVKDDEKTYALYKKEKGQHK